jgi:2-dehydro-3-deoxygluconokinase
VNEKQFDFISLGAIIHRIDSGIIPFRKATECKVHVSGGEFNVAANLASCFRMKTGFITAMVKYPVGELVESRIRGMGVIPFYKYFEHDGVTGPNIGTVYSDRGGGVRAPVVFYNRSNEAAALLKPEDFDWEEIFGNGIRWFHSGGIFAALSESSGKVIIEGMKEAKKRGAMTSMDLNFRKKLWARLGGEKRAAEVMREIIKNVDVIVGNEEDLQKGLGIEGPEASGDLDNNAFYDMIEKVLKNFPHIKVIATTLREVKTTNRHKWSAVAWREGEKYTAPVADLDVYDRVGGGDGFASGLFYGILQGRSLEESVKLGWAHGALVTTFPGDTTMASLEEVEAFAKGGSARIQR